MQKVKVNIYLERIRRNAEAFKRLTKRSLYAVVKADAYGHGAEEVVNALEGVADGFAVALIEEGLAVRHAACGKEILVFTPPTEEEEIFVLAKNGFSVTVDGLETAMLVVKAVNRFKLSISVHLKINTGMNRYGIEADETEEICRFLKKYPRVSLKGVYTHLAESSIVRARKQLALFASAVSVCKRHYPLVVAHTGGSYAALLGEDFLFDAVRVGIGLYGYFPCSPSEKTGVSQAVADGLSLQKGMAVYAKTVARRTFEKGSVGYGEECFDGKGLLSVCRFGYADGFLRQRQNGLDGSEDFANELCMDACIRWGDFAKGCYTEIMSDAEKTALSVGTIPYEVLCAATRRAERIYDGETVFCGNGRTDDGGEEKGTSHLGESTTGGSG